MIQIKFVNQVLVIGMIQSKLGIQVLLIAMIQYRTACEQGVDDNYDTK